MEFDVLGMVLPHQSGRVFLRLWKFHKRVEFHSTAKRGHKKMKDIDIITIVPNLFAYYAK
jgi:hypothetical protein